MTKVRTKPENPWLNILFNLILPVLILEKLTGPIGHWPALALGLAFPIGYGLYDYWKRKKRNWLSLLGVVNVGFTGGFAVAGLTGSWFAIKEALFPFLLGLLVLGSAWTRRPAMKVLLFEGHALDADRIERQVDSLGVRPALNAHLKKSSLIFSSSFFLSSALNYFLARRIFTEIPATLTGSEQAEILNQQIAKMTSWSFPVIMLPMMILTGLIGWHTISHLRSLTGLTLEELLPHHR